MALLELDSLWQAVFEHVERPQLYTGEETDEDNFKPLNDPQKFIVDHSDLNHDQLYVLSSNNQLAMALAQQEYWDLERRIAVVKGKSKESVRNPQIPQEIEVFEARKESELYGYKFEANKPALLHAGIPGLRSADELSEREKHDVSLFQEPFEQGGFVPNQKQYKSLIAKAKNPLNVDGWKPIEKKGRRMIPRQQTHHDEYTMVYIKKAIAETDENVRMKSPGSEISLDTSNKLVNKRLTRTRYDGRKHPPTRDVSEAPSGVSTPRRKRINSPVPYAREGTPSKRRKVRAEELQNAESQPRRDFSIPPLQKPEPDPVVKNESSWNLLSPNSLRRRKWTDEELVDAVKHNHLWLHDDPVKAEDWKHKIMQGTNPVRSFSMFKKWAYWKDENKDKRPRGKKDGLPKSDLSKGPEIEHSSQTSTVNGFDKSFSPSPHPSASTEMSETGYESFNQPAQKVNHPTFRIKTFVRPGDVEDDLHRRGGTQRDYKFEQKFQPNENYHRQPDLGALDAILRREEIGDEITVYIGDREPSLFDGKREMTVTPLPRSPLTHTSTATPTSNKRSTRSSRRGSG